MLHNDLIDNKLSYLHQFSMGGGIWTQFYEERGKDTNP